MISENDIEIAKSDSGNEQWVGSLTQGWAT